MADSTKIEWTDATWNPITGCSIVSPGCTNCYAMRLAGTRLKHHPSRVGLTQASKAGPVWNGRVRLNEDWLDQPVRWKRPRRIFVCAHGDLFHESVPGEWIDRVFAVAAIAPQHTFQVLTKRAERMRTWFEQADPGERLHNATLALGFDDDVACAVSNWVNGWSRWRHMPADDNPLNGSAARWPLPNVWLGVSVEDQAAADERIPELLDTPAAVRFISAEPLLGPVDLRRVSLVPKRPGSPRPGIHADALAGRYVESGLAYTGEWDINGPPPPESERRRLNWVIVGGESGPGSRPMLPAWARSLRDQCLDAGVPYFMKQWGDYLVGEEDRHGRNGLPITFQDGDEFDVISDGHDIILSAAYDEPGGPTHLWREYYGWNHRLIRRLGKGRAGRLLDGRTWDEMPEAAP